MHQRGRHDERVIDRLRIRNLQLCGAFGDCGVHGQDTALKCGHDLAFEPSPEDRPLRRVALFDQQDADFKLGNGDGEE